MDRACKADITSDDIEQMLVEYYKDSDEMPNSTQRVVETALFKERLLIRKNFAILYQIITIITSIVFLGTSVVYAKNPYNSLTFWFDTENIVSNAIKNRYIQNINTAYIYSNNVGIKANSVIISDTAFSINFQYNYNIENITELSINEMVVENENNNKLYNYKREKEEDLEMFTETVKRAYSYQNIDEEDIQCFSSNFIEANSLNIKITSVRVKNGSEYRIINGNWNIKIDLDSNMKTRQKEQYYATYENYKESEQYSKYIKQIVAELNETTMKVKIALNTRIEEDILIKKDSILLSNLNTLSTYDCIYCNIESDNTTTVIEAAFDLSSFEEDIDDLEFTLVISRTNCISISLKK